MGALYSSRGKEADGVLALLTDEQVMLQDMARDLGCKLGLANPADLDTADAGACWQELARTGLLGFRIRDESGAGGQRGRGGGGERGDGGSARARRLRDLRGPGP